MKRSDLRRRLDALVAKISPAHRGAARRDVDRILGAGVHRYEDLLAFALDERQTGDTRAIACWLLGRLRDPAGIAALRAALHQAEPPVREAAACALGELDATEAVAPLVALLAGEKDAAVRRAIVASLGLLGDLRALDPLTAILADQTQSPLLRGTAAEALGDLRDAGAVPPLIAALSDPEPEVRFYAAFALGEIGDARAISALQERVDHRDVAAIAGAGSVEDEAREALRKIRARGGRPSA